MQPNMSEGKSSVIISTVAAALADGSRLVYVIVDNPQSEKMFQILVSKLGSFLDRQVYHMPFSLCPGLFIILLILYNTWNRLFYAILPNTDSSIAIP